MMAKLTLGLIALISLLLAVSPDFSQESPSFWQEDDWSAHLRLNSAEDSYQYFKEIHANESFEAHTAAHQFGQALYDIYGLRGMSVCDQDFGGGCLHGYIGQMVIVDGTGHLDSIIKECELVNPDNILDCRHGIGHGLQLIFGYSENALGQALNSCKEKFYATNYDESLDPTKQCYHGVFMEYNQQNITHGDIFTHREFNDDNLYNPCDVLDEEYKSACYYRLVRLWVISHSSENPIKLYPEIGDWCESMPDLNQLESCQRGLWTTITSYGGVDDFDTATEVCEATFDKHDAYSSCIAEVSDFFSS